MSKYSNALGGVIMKYREETKLKDSSLKKRLVAFIIALTMIVNELPWSIMNQKG